MEIMSSRVVFLQIYLETHLARAIKEIQQEREEEMEGIRQLKSSSLGLFACRSYK